MKCLNLLYKAPLRPVNFKNNLKMELENLNRYEQKEKEFREKLSKMTRKEKMLLLHNNMIELETLLSKIGNAQENLTQIEKKLDNFSEKYL